MYGRTAVDLNSCVGSLLAVGLVVFVSFRINEEGYLLHSKQVPTINVSFVQR